MRPARLALLCLSLLGNAPMALAQPDNPEKQMQEVMKKVQLNKEQKERVRQIRSGGRAQLQALRDDMDKRRRELNQLLDTNGDDAALRQAFQNLQNARRGLEKARFDRMLAIRAVLSEQQKAAFQSLRLRDRSYSEREEASSQTRRE